MGFRGFQFCKILSSKWTVVFFWGGNWFHTFNDFLNMENVKILPYKIPRYQKNAFLGHFRLLHGIICLHIPTTSSLAVSLRGQPSFYGHRFTRYEFCDFFPLPGLFPANRPSPKIWHLFFLTLRESRNQFLKRKWIYMEVHPGVNSAPAVTIYDYFLAWFESSC